MKNSIEMFKASEAETMQEMTMGNELGTHQGAALTNELGTHQGAALEQTMEKGERFNPLEMVREGIETVREQFEKLLEGDDQSDGDDEDRKMFEQFLEGVEADEALHEIAFGSSGERLGSEYDYRKSRVEQAQRELERSQKRIDDLSRQMANGHRVTENMISAKNAYSTAKSRYNRYVNELNALR